MTKKEQKRGRAKEEENEEGVGGEGTHVQVAEKE